MDEVREAVHEVADTAPSQARDVAKREGRRWYLQSVAAAVFVAFIVATAAAGGVLYLFSRQASTDAAVSQLRQIATDAKQQGDAANTRLAQRGEAPVPIPQPGTAPDSDVLVAAATARVLASIPVQEKPTASTLGAAIAQFLAANPPSTVGPTPQQIAEALAGYLTVNPPPSGPAGPSGSSAVPGTYGEQGLQDPSTYDL